MTHHESSKRGPWQRTFPATKRSPILPHLDVNPSPNHFNFWRLAMSIVLVHGAWGDGSHWPHVIPPLHAKGYQVSAVWNPLTSLMKLDRLGLNTHTDVTR